MSGISKSKVYTEEVQPAAMKSAPGSSKSKGSEGSSKSSKSKLVGASTGNIDNMFRMMTSGKTPEKGKKRRQMLTSAQLSALFSRLDKDGDGDLDLDEFTGIIKMLHMHVTPDYIAKVFRAVENPSEDAYQDLQDVKGTLDIEQFISAYQLIFSGTERSDLGEGGKDGFARATRYGCDEKGNYLFECYTIHPDGRGKKFTLRDMPSASTKMHELQREGLLEKLSSAETQEWKGSLEDVSAMMHRDGLRNARDKSKILWWVDLSFLEVNMSVAEELVANFGLPNTSKLMSCFGNWGGALGVDPKTRMYAGKGSCREGSVWSLSVFAQTLWMQHRPVVHQLPVWIDAWQGREVADKTLLGRCIRRAVLYYTSRFSWMFNLSWTNSTAADERAGAYERAAALGEFIKRTEDEGDIESDDDTVDVDFKPDSTIFSTNAEAMPLRDEIRYARAPTWLPSSTKLYNSPPRIQIDTCSFHILDHGYGAHSLVTVRQIDAEGHPKKTDLEQLSRTGTVGRILSGVWARMAEVTMLGGSASVSGELLDSPASVATLALLAMHTFSMDSSTGLDNWLKLLEKEIKDVVVSKHSSHIDEARRMLKEFLGYVEPMVSLLRTMMNQQAEKMQQELEEGYADVISHPTGSSKISMKKSSPQKGNDLQKGNDPERRQAFSENVEKVPLTFATVEPFLGVDSYRELRMILDGHEHMKGLLYWEERLKKYGSKIEELKSLISAQLDEKRNFMSFMLTIITTVLAPLALLTGYFGMNFDNMAELDSNTYPSTPGIAFMWVITGSAYAFLLVIALHFRILYSAT
ncbi:hypothetical protein B484DRAFT_442681 [Ochromonadaceae sp. CCMP2298]|nr:hypothetical protein B484DRAFT_442681 [Ochromonadaceae sp. CCMP2298]